MKKLIFLFIAFTTVNFAQLIGPKIVAQQSEFDFGQVNQGEKVTHIFVITNSGGDLLKISNVHASCGCTVANPEKDELSPGESTNLVVTFNSKGRFGKQKKLITVESNDPENPKIVLTLKGSVKIPESESANYPVLHFGETQHDFGKVKEGKVVEYTFRFQNKGKSTLNITDIRTSCGCTAALVSDNSIKPGQNGTLKVELDTSKRHGKMSRTVTVKSDDPKHPVQVLTVYADVQ